MNSATSTWPDALALAALYREAVRWHGRFALETTGLELADSQLALAALVSLPTDVEGAQALLGRLGRRYRVPGFR